MNSRRLLSLALTLGFLCLLALPSASAGSTVTLQVEAYGPNEGYHFEFNGNSTPNPTVTLHPGDHVVIDLHVDAAANDSHNFHVDAPVGAETPCCTSANKTATVSFDVPTTATGTIAYYCIVHRASGMRGLFQIAAASSTAKAIGTPGFEAILGLVAFVGAALVAWARRTRG